MTHAGETSNWLNNNMLVGFTKTRGLAYKILDDKDSEGRPNYFEGAIPVTEVEDRLFDWTPVPVTFKYDVEDAETGEITVRHMPDRIGAMHSKTGDIMGIFAEGYPFTSYRERLLTNLGNIFDQSKGELGIGSAGVLKGGAQAWVQIEMPTTVTAAGGVEFKPTLLAASSFNGSLSTSFVNTATMLVCNNQFNAGVSDKSGNRFSFKNTKNSQLKIQSAREALGILFKDADLISGQIERLLKVEVDEADWKSFLVEHTELAAATDKAVKGGRARNALTRAEEKLAQLDTLWTDDPRVAPWKGTAFGVVQAVNTWEHHLQGQLREGTTREERNVTRMVSDYYGDVDRGTLATLAKVGVTI